MRGKATRPGAARTIHRSFLLPAKVVEEARRLIPLETAANLNQLVAVALRELVESYKRRAFEREMERMSCDPAISSASRVISREAEATESDGLHP